METVSDGRSGTDALDYELARAPGETRGAAATLSAPPGRTPRLCCRILVRRTEKERPRFQLLLQTSGLRILPPLILFRRGLGLRGLHRRHLLRNKKMPTPLGPPQDPRHRPTVGS